ncbi:MAG: N-acetylmuramoyl-L-alanine amidase [Rhodospirillales bacterium]|nr:MAG: N-acetylmuramoyl-L-alanine amidase [Rhodospirillales bacterium]
MAFSLTWLPKVLKDAGLKVAEQPGWQLRGHGDVGQIRGVMCHHTAGSPSGNMPSLGIVTNGRSDLSGPLAQLCLARDGTFIVVAAGRAFHAGPGEWQGVTTGNSSFIGIEAENTGHTSGPKAEFPWPGVQMDAYARGCAAILTHIGADPIMCCGHKEYRRPKGFKSDPTFDMNVFRLDVRNIMTGAVPPPVLIPAEDPAHRPTLRRPAAGHLVKLIQAKVGVPETGEFDGVTEAAVRRFQRIRGLVPDGIVGPKTWAAIDGA